MASAALVAGGCPAPRSAGDIEDPCSVIVIGGGLAGLYCARELALRGHPVRLLEAKAKPGGRILTVREPWHDGQYVEAGATHVMRDADLLQLCKTLNVELKPPPAHKALKQIRVFGGTRTLLAPDEEPPPEFALSEEEQRLGEQGRMDKYFALSKTFDPLKPPPAALAELDRLTGAEYLRRSGASAGFIAMIDSRVGLGARGIQGMSALSLVQIWASIFFETAFLGPSLRVVGGSDRLPFALAAELGDKIIYEAEVLCVQNVANGLRVTFQKRDEQHELRAERVVLAIPPGVLARLTIIPRLSPAKLRALRELALESVTRVWLETDTRFWEARGESAGGESDLELGGLRDEAAGSPGEHGILGLYARRGPSQLLSASSETERIDAAFAHAERFHPDVRAHVTATASKCWDSDPFQRGAYAYFEPGQVTGLAPHLSTREGKLHFAGDHTSQRPGFMHGALASARRVLDEIDPEPPRSAGD